MSKALVLSTLLLALSSSSGAAALTTEQQQLVAASPENSLPPLKGGGGDAVFISADGKSVQFRTTNGTTQEVSSIGEAAARLLDARNGTLQNETATTTTEPEPAKEQPEPRSMPLPNLRPWQYVQQLFINPAPSDHNAWILKELPLVKMEGLLYQWNMALKARGAFATTYDPYVSCVVAKYLSHHHADELTTAQVMRLMSAEYLPVIHVDCAVDLIALQRPPPSTTTTSSDELTDLERRALDALSSSMHNGPALEQLAQLPNKQHLLNYLTNQEEEEPELERDLPTAGPHRILVQESRIPGLNGIFKLKGKRSRGKKARHAQQQIEYINPKGFTMRLEKDVDGRDQWVIADADATVYFRYQVYADNDLQPQVHVDASQVPPLFGWLPSHLKSGPAPVLLFQHGA